MTYVIRRYEMQLTPTQEQLDIIMYKVSQYLNKFKNVHTKTLYKTLRIKEKGLSLNKKYYKINVNVVGYLMYGTINQLFYK
jgi:hypothetical protein